MKPFHPWPTTAVAAHAKCADCRHIGLHYLPDLEKEFWAVQPVGDLQIAITTASLLANNHAFVACTYPDGQLVWQDFSPGNYPTSCDKYAGE